MMDFSLFKKYNSISNQGSVYKNNTDMIIDAAWDRDPQSCKAYLYDYEHDDEPDKKYNLFSYNSLSKTPIDIKFSIKSYNSFDSKQVAYCIQFRPYQNCNVDYYNELYAHKYGSIFPVGLYIDIPDDKGVYRRWLVIDKADYYSQQFPTWFVLPCEYRYSWVYNMKKYQMWGTLRTKAFSGIGVSGDTVKTLNGNLQEFLPLNIVTENLYYNQRIIISAPTQEPTSWSISDVNNIASIGIIRLTFEKDVFDQNKDYIEKDNAGNIVAMWANYYNNVTEPKSDPVLDYATAKIKYNGSNPYLKIGGSYKTLTFTDLYEEYRDSTVSSDVKWDFYINNINIELIDEPLLDIRNENNKSISIRFIGSDDYLNNTVKVTATCNNCSAELVLELIGM